MGIVRINAANYYESGFDRWTMWSRDVGDGNRWARKDDQKGGGVASGCLEARHKYASSALVDAIGLSE